MKIILGIILAAVMVAGLFAFNSSEAKVSESSDKPVYLIKSHNSAIKNQLEVRHNFDVGFTAKLNEHQLAGLKKAGFDVETVPLYQIAAPPGSCTPWPSCKSGGGGDDPSTRANFPSAQYPYGVNMVNGGSGGAGVTVTVLDTGVFKDHLDLNVALCKDATKNGIKNGCNDSHGHGTHVSGTIAANGGDDGDGIFGVAPDATLWVIKVCGNSGCWSDDIAAAIRYAANQGTNIISMSLGGDTPSSLITSAVDHAVNKKVLVVAAAGNDGPSFGSIDWPGANADIIAVGAIDSNKNVASWSSRGINDGDYIIIQREVEVGAPGVSVESTWNNGGYRTISGTSMATPHVAGLAAKLWQGDGESTRGYLQDLAKVHNLDVPGDDPATGFGLPIAP